MGDEQVPFILQKLSAGETVKLPYIAMQGKCIISQFCRVIHPGLIGSANGMDIDKKITII
jgi:hypothetical protein